MAVLVTYHGLLDDPVIRKVIENCFDKVVFMRSGPREDVYMVLSKELDEMGIAPNDGVDLTVNMFPGVDPVVTHIEKYEIRK